MLVDRKKERQFVFNHQLLLPIEANKSDVIDEFNKIKISKWIGKYFHQLDSIKINIELIKISNKSQVYKLSVDKEDYVIFKFFSIRQDFINEYFALTFFENGKFIPKVIDYNEKYSYLVLEYINNDFLANDIYLIGEIAHNLGKVHSYSLFHENLLSDMFREKTEWNFLNNIDGCNWILNKKFFKEGLMNSIKYYGEKRIPIMIGDIKPEHVRLRRGQDIVFIDMETFCVGLPDYLDILSLINFNPKGGQFSKKQWLYLLENYLKGKNQTIPNKKEVEVNYKIISLIYKSFYYEK